jgi:hypothetical protein
MNRVDGEDKKEKFDWGAVAPSEHIAQFYEHEDELLDALSAFVGEGLKMGDSAIVIATPEHLRALRYRLDGMKADLIRAMFEDRYITLDARVALSSFMVDDHVDERLFSEMARSLLRRAAVNNRRVRGFGEMVALLWAAGNRDAVVALERLWEQVSRAHGLSILCSYPKALFPAVLTEKARLALDDIRAAHTLLL